MLEAVDYLASRMSQGQAASPGLVSPRSAVVEEARMPSRRRNPNPSQVVSKVEKEQSDFSAVEIEVFQPPKALQYSWDRAVLSASSPDSGRPKLSLDVPLWEWETPLIPLGQKAAALARAANEVEASAEAGEERLKVSGTSKHRQHVPHCFRNVRGYCSAWKRKRFSGGKGKNNDYKRGEQR